MLERLKADAVMSKFATQRDCQAYRAAVEDMLTMLRAVPYTEATAHPDHPVSAMCALNGCQEMQSPLKAWGGDIPLRGDGAPKNDGRIKHLIEYLLTVYERFGNTTVTASLQWGAQALWKRDEQAQRIVELEEQVKAARSASVPPLESWATLHTPHNEDCQWWVPKELAERQAAQSATRPNKWEGCRSPRQSFNFVCASWACETCGASNIAPACKLSSSDRGNDG